MKTMILPSVLSLTLASTAVLATETPAVPAPAAAPQAVAPQAPATPDFDKMLKEQEAYNQAMRAHMEKMRAAKTPAERHQLMNEMMKKEQGFMHKLQKDMGMPAAPEVPPGMQRFMAAQDKHMRGMQKRAEKFGKQRHEGMKGGFMPPHYRYQPPMYGMMPSYQQGHYMPGMMPPPPYAYGPAPMMSPSMNAPMMGGMEKPHGKGKAHHCKGSKGQHRMMGMEHPKGQKGKKGDERRAAKAEHRKQMEERLARIEKALEEIKASLAE